MRVWLDDRRAMPIWKPEWKGRFAVHVKTAQEAIELLSRGNVTHISLDHDLGPVEVCGTGYQVATYIEEQAFLGKLPQMTWAIHSQNPVGADNMKRAMTNADRYWQNNA